MISALHNPPLDLADADDDAGQAAAGRAVESSGPQGWRGPVDYGVEFGQGHKARKRRLAFIAALPDAMKQREQTDSGRSEWKLRGDVVLPSGRTVAAVAQSSAYRSIPDEVKRGTAKQRQRDLARRELYELDRGFQREHSIPAATDRYFAEFERVHGAWAAERGLSCKRGAMLILRRRIAEGAVLDGRYRSGRKPVQHDPRLLKRVREIALHPNKFAGADADAEQQRLAAQLGIAPLTYSAVQRVIAALPAAAKGAGLLREREFEARYVPKMRIDYTGVPAGDWVCEDGRVPDVQVRLPDPSGGWRAARLTVTGVMDMRSTKLVVDVRETENWVGILAGNAAWYRECGFPLHVTQDQGKAYRKLARAHGRKTWEKAAVDVTAVASVFERFGIQVHSAIAYHPWAKKLESIWRLVKKHSDRWCESFWGGRPAERPETAEDLVKYHVEELPTGEEFREWVFTAVETINSTPRRALGGLSPNMMFERFRGTVRRVDPDVFDTYFTVAEGPRRVGRDGLRYRNMLYELEAADLVKLQGRDVWVLPRLDDAGLVALCDKDERLLCYAAEQRLIRAGSKDEHVRAMFAKKARVRRMAKQYLAERDFLLDTTTGQILRTQRDFAKSREAELRKQQPAATAPDVQVVRADLADQAGRMKKKLSPFKRLAENAGAPGESPVPAARAGRRAAFARLADNGIDVSAERRARVDWSQQTGGVMEDAQTEQPRRRRIVADAG